MNRCYAGHEHGLLSQHLIRHGMMRVVSFPFKKSWRHTTLLQSLFEKKIERVAEAFRIIRSDDSFLFAHMKQKVKMADMFEHNGIFLYVLKRAPYSDRDLPLSCLENHLPTTTHILFPTLTHARQ